MLILMPFETGEAFAMASQKILTLYDAYSSS